MRRASAWLLSVALFLTPALAAAVGPNVWDLARDREVARLDQVIERANEQLEQASALGVLAFKRELVLEVRSELEPLVSRYDDPRLAFVLGHAFEMLDDDARVIRLLPPAIERMPDHPLALRAMFDLAVAYARSDRPADEVRTYDMLLERQTDESWRHVVLMNRAESRAKLGQLDEAIADYRASIALSPDMDGVLARWGLAVTLDRSGDFARAMEEAVAAYAFDDGEVSRIDRGGVFFVPAYDRWWYHAIRQMAAGRAASNPDDKLMGYERAVAFWSAFVAQAPSSERWLPLAKARLHQCETIVEKLRVEQKKKPRSVKAAPLER